MFYEAVNQVENCTTEGIHVKHVFLNLEYKILELFLNYLTT